jgi:hypothetical protein
MRTRRNVKAPMRLSRKLRARLYYTVEAAGAQVLWSRSESYRAVTRGDIPIEMDGKFYRVPREKWDSIVRRLREKLRGSKRRAAKTAPEAAAKAAETATA